MHKCLAAKLASHAIDIERDYQEQKFPDGTAANPMLTIADKLNWITEEYLEVIMAYNDGKPARPLMHEVVQLGALCRALIESHLQSDPEFPEYVKTQRDADLSNLHKLLAINS